MKLIETLIESLDINAIHIFENLLKHKLLSLEIPIIDTIIKTRI
jgi:hypothetical protein